MADALRELLEGLGRLWPAPTQWATYGTFGLAWTAAAFAFTGHLKRRRSWRTGDTRKLFHFLVFGAAAFAQVRGGPGATSAFSAAVSLLVFCAIARGDGNPWFEALARESDAPHRARYVVVPWFATMAGGVLANLWFRDHALFGYLAVGLGDAVGEPIGIRFGRHRYRVPLPARVIATRSIEGSAAVLVASFVAGLVALSATQPALVAPGASWLRLAAFAGVATLVEAVAPHGWDNFVLQLAAAATAAALFPS